MTFLKRAAMGALLLGVSACATAGYLDPTAAPAFGQATLSAGFTPDPYLVDIVAGGDLDASSLGAGCAGGIASSPDFRVTYRAGAYPLSFAAISGSDTTLVINGPDGQYHCDDDSGGEGDPFISFTRPQSGVYDIWVGVYGGGTADAVLYVSEE
ncbi:MAG: peptidase S1 [Pseudomonadota bacterium]